MKEVGRRVGCVLAVCLLVGSMVIWAPRVNAATVGPNGPGTAGTDTTVGTIAWSSTGNITASDGSSATASPTDGTITNYITATNFGFSIPAGATINGVTAEVQRKEGALSTKASIRDSGIYVIKGGTIMSTGGTNQAATATDWPTTAAFATYGSGSDTWGVALSDADVTASNFGVAISAKNNRVSNPGATESANIDYVRVTITYTANATYTQSAYRWYANADSVQPGSALAAETTAASTANTSVARLRMAQTVATANLAASGKSFKLQSSTSTSGPWTDVSNTGWYNASWAYRKPIVVTNPNGSLTNYQTSMTIDTAALVTASKLRSDCGDLRFTNSDATTLLDYWIESGCNTSTTKVWVKIPSLSATASKTMYMYYGNSSATTAESPTNVFPLFDDFNGSSLDSKWTATGSTSVSGGALTISTGSVYTPSNSYYSMPGMIVESKLHWTSTATQYGGLVSANRSTLSNFNSASDSLTSLSITTGNNLAAYGADGTTTTYNLANGIVQFAPVVNTEYIIGLANTSSQLVYYKDRAINTSVTGNWSASAYTILGYFTGGSGGTIAISPQVMDWVLARQYVTNPVTATVNNEQASASNWRFKDNATPADGATVTSALLTGSPVAESYSESHPTVTNPNAITSGSKGEWDFALDPQYVAAGTYYFRMVSTDGTGAVFTYSAYPQITVTVANAAPNSPTSLAQVKTDNTSIATGNWTNESSVKFTAQATDPNSGDTIQLCVEAQPIGTSFTGTATGCGSAVAYSGSAVSVNVTLSGLTNGTQYHWQAWAKDNGGLSSSTVSYGGNAESAADFGIDTATPKAAGTASLTEGAFYGRWFANSHGGTGTQSITQGLVSKVLQQIPQTATSSGLTYSSLATSMSSYGDITLQADVNTRQQLRTGSSPDVGEVGWLVWDYSDSTHFYFFRLKTNGWELGKKDPSCGGGQCTLDSAAGTYNVGTAYTLKIQQSSNTFTAWINGTQVSNYTDTSSPYSTGKVGLYAKDAKVDWDNVTVTSYP